MDKKNLFALGVEPYSGTYYAHCGTLTLGFSFHLWKLCFMPKIAANVFGANREAIICGSIGFAAGIEF